MHLSNIYIYMQKLANLNFHSGDQLWILKQNFQDMEFINRTLKISKHILHKIWWFFPNLLGVHELLLHLHSIPKIDLKLTYLRPSLGFSASLIVILVYYILCLLYYSLFFFIIWWPMLFYLILLASSIFCNT